MSYRWKPNASQKSEYAAKMKAKESEPTHTTSYAIRTGCKLVFFSVKTGKRETGEVLRDSYGSNKGHHTFSILTKDSGLILIKGRNLYPNIIEHIQGLKSKEL